MSLAWAGMLAMALSFAVFITATVWYAAPWLSQRSRADALIPVLWVHAFRYVALQIVSAQRAGFSVSNGLRDEILYGDLVGAVLALLSIAALRKRASSAIPLVWVFAVASAVDLVNASIGGTREGALSSAVAVTWLILTFYVPILYTSLGLIIWELVHRRQEALG